MSDGLLSDLAEALVALRLEDAERITREALVAGIPAIKVMLEGLSPAMREVGRKFEEKTYFLAELLMAAYIMDRCNAILRPLLEREITKAPSPGRVVIGTVQGDLHDIGKNIVIALMRAAGFEVYDLGVDVPAAEFVRKVRETQADIVGMSALLASTAPYFRTVVDELKRAGLRDTVFVMIGGPQASQEHARAVGADAYCKDAVVGVDEALDYARMKRGR